MEITRALNRNFILADGLQLLVRHGNSIPLFLRYQVQAERLYRRALEEFERLKNLRPELQIEPDTGNGPQPAEIPKPQLQFEPNPDGGPRSAETPQPQSNEPLPALAKSGFSPRQANGAPPSASSRQAIATENPAYFPQPLDVSSISSKSRAAPSPVSVRIT